MPYLPINEDIVLIMNIIVSSTDGFWQAPVSNEMYKGMEMWKKAFENAPKISPAVLKPISSMLFGEDSDNILGKSEAPIHSMYVLTNESGMFGASSLFYEGVQQMIRDLIGDYYALPSSIHEWVIIPKDDSDVEYMRDLVRSANRDIVGQEEVLSDEVYIFDGQLHIA